MSADVPSEPRPLRLDGDFDFHHYEDSRMLKLARPDYDALRQHGEETYPHECCGILLGRMDDDGTRIVTSATRCGTMRPGRSIPSATGRD